MELFIDDIRVPSDVGLCNSDYIIAIDYNSAMKIILEHKPQFITFDHDLGDDATGTGYDIAKCLCELDMDYPDAGFITENFEFNVHSANPVGRKNIEKYLDSYTKTKFDFL